MPAIAKRKPSTALDLDHPIVNRPSETRDSTPQKRKLRSDSSPMKASPVSTPMKWTSPRRSANASPNTPPIGIESDYFGPKLPKSPGKNLSKSLIAKPNWNPRDVEQTRAVKEALHVSTAPSVVVCREDEQKRVLEFCKSCLEEDKAGSLYVCGCPGTGKSLSMEKVKKNLVDWALETGLEQPDVLTINCTSLANTCDIFSKILGKDQQWKRSNRSTSALQLLQNLYSQSSGKKMT